MSDPWKTIDLVIKETFFWYDGPLLFSFHHEGALRIACAVDFLRKDGSTLFKVCSPSPEMLEAMKENRVDLRSVYETAPFFDMVCDRETRIRSGGPMDEDDLPDPGVRLTLTLDLDPEMQ